MEDGATAVYCEATTTASSSKILDIGSESHPDILSGYRLMDVNILDGIFNCLTCPECYEVETLHLNDTNATKKGPARLTYLKCNSCTYVKEFYTSKNVMIVRSTFVQWWHASFWGRIYTAKEIVLLLEYARTEE